MHQGGTNAGLILTVLIFSKTSQTSVQELAPLRMCPPQGTIIDLLLLWYYISDIICNSPGIATSIPGFCPPLTGKQSCLPMQETQETQVWSLGWEDLLEDEMANTPVFFWGFRDDSDSKESACHVGDRRSILGLQRYPGEGNGNPRQYPCLENPMDKGYSPQRVGHDWATNNTTPKLGMTTYPNSKNNTIRKVIQILPNALLWKPNKPV